MQRSYSVVLMGGWFGDSPTLLGGDSGIKAPASCSPITFNIVIPKSQFVCSAPMEGGKSMKACKWELFWFCFCVLGPRLEMVHSISIPCYWLELNHMSPGDCKGDWEKQLCAKEEQEMGL